MPKWTPSRRNVIKGAAATGAFLIVPVDARASPASPTLLALQERLLVARTARDRLHEVVDVAQRNRPPVPPSIERREFKGLYHGPHHWIAQGRPDLAVIARAYSAAVDAADAESNFDAKNDALEAAVEIVGDIESDIVDFEPRSIADLRLQVELALHQEVVDHGMYDALPQLICERFLRLTPGAAG